MKIKTLNIIVIIILISFLILLFIPDKKKKINTKSINSRQEISKTSLQGPANINGWLKCLSSKDQNNNTCLIGLEDKQGRNYGLTNPLGQQLDQSNLPAGAIYKAQGNYIPCPNFLENYKIIGTIKLNE